MPTPPPPIRVGVPVREIPCAECGTIFGQTAAQLKGKICKCKDCRKAYNDARRTARQKGQPKYFLEVVLPTRPKPHFDAAKNEWYLKVRVRKQGSDEPLVQDRVYLGIDGNTPKETVDAVYASAYARQQMNGAQKLSSEEKKKHRKKIKSIVHDVRSWKQGRDRDLGVSKHIIKKVVFKVYLADPKIDGVKLYFGRFSTRAEARKVRDQHYKELRAQYIPCACCGKLPIWKKGQLSHFSSVCENRVELPIEVRPLLQAKLWNLVFSTGQSEVSGRITTEDLYCMGYLFKPAKSVRFFARADVEYDFSLAKNYLRKRKTEEEPVFE